MKGQSQHITRDEPLQAAVGNLISFNLLPIIGQNTSTSKGRVLAKGTFAGSDLLRVRKIKSAHANFCVRICFCGPAAGFNPCKPTLIAVNMEIL